MLITPFIKKLAHFIDNLDEKTEISFLLDYIDNHLRYLLEHHYREHVYTIKACILNCKCPDKLIPNYSP